MRKYLIDTHVHLLSTKQQSVINYDEAIKIFDLASNLNIYALCITEHLEARLYNELVKSIFIDNCFKGKQENGCLRLKNGLILFPGAECQLENGTNIGVHTDVESLLSLNNRQGYYSLDNLYDELKRVTNMFALVAHHILWPGKGYHNYDHLAEFVDAIEVPAKDIKNAKQYKLLASSYLLPTTGGSDAHNFIQVGAGLTEIDHGSEYLGHHDLIWNLKAGGTKPVLSESAIRLVTMSKMYRKTGAENEITAR